MVQVDVFWTYALGASFAVAASKQIQNGVKENKEKWFANPYFSAALLYLGILFAPSGICLLWAFPSWETMHVGDRNLPGWLVTAFAVTNITQGVLGFWVAYRFIIAGKKYLAALQIYIGYLLMFFILVHGWDGTGYKRFFSATKADFLNWKLTNIFAWFISDVAITLYIFGIFLIPVLIYAMSKWIANGAADDQIENESKANIALLPIAKSIFAFIFIYCLGSAIAASLLIHIAGWGIGLGIFFVAAFALLLRKGGFMHKHVMRMLLLDDSVK